ncbi:MAG: hypothetical protein M3O15_09170 [Acidobacteriota bacterium]|nr:hypothetical protein [Acidobacteriota bacterium]
MSDLFDISDIFGVFGVFGVADISAVFCDVFDVSDVCDVSDAAAAAPPGPRFERPTFMHKIKPSTLILLCLLVAWQGAVSRPAGAVDFVVVINAANSTTILPASEVSNMFLHKTMRWKFGEKILAVDLPEDSPLRESFSKTIHGKSTSAVKAYWQRLIFSGRDVPPPEKASTAEVLAYVRANSGAVGYVGAGTQLGDGVKILRVAP